jgi:transcriptional regulator with XRE-family HTH domain
MAAKPAASPAEIREMRRLARFLKALRAATAITQDDVAAHLRVNRYRVSYLERGSGWPSDSELAAMLKLYKATRADTLLAKKIMIEGAAVGSVWWEQYLEYMPRSLQTLVDCESAATLIQVASSVVVPGLLQTRAYTQALFEFEKAEKGTAQTEALLEVRQRRGQEAFGRREPSVRVEAVFTEGALRTEVGGREVMRQQLDHMLYLAANPQVAIRILHFGSGSVAAIVGSFTIIDYGGARPATYHADVVDGIAIVEGKSSVSSARKRFNTLADRALSPEGSIDLLKEIRKGM